jgi:DNA-binding GntR family transcriptional regulator
MPPNIAELRSPEEPEIEPRLYMQVARAICRKIESGELKPGDTVSIADLMEKYGVARQTASKGLRVLCKEGRMNRWPGVGYTVQYVKDDAN